MLGTFSNDQPIIEIEVSGVSVNPKRFEALIDSGFNGYLQIPLIDAFPLGLILAGIQATTLANGTTSNHLVCRGKVCIDGKCIETTIDIEQGSNVLIGTKLLKELEKTFILNCVSGRVEIVENEPIKQ